jgi:DNA (cytosine-5)-methyltransferase 1
MTRNTQVEQIASAVHLEAGHSILAYFPRALSRLRRFGEFFEVFRRLFVVICVPSPWSYVPERNPARECRIFGAPQSRKRLVLIASRLGVPQLPEPSHPKPEDWITVRATISNLPAIKAGATHTTDPVHTSSRLTPINLKRTRASIPGGTWRDWPTQLIAKCHTRETGRTYPAVYGRMVWDAPSPTITGQCFGFGNGRFGHPEQDRAILLREAAMLQTFSPSYSFVPDGTSVEIGEIGQMIGNAVPPRLGKAIGIAIRHHVLASAR